jgi:hypothetical protein
MSARSAARAAALALALACGACQSAKKPVTLYDWGEYEDSIYRMYVKSGEFRPEAELHVIETLMEEDALQLRRIPPGVRAHAAMLCAATGDTSAAAAYLRGEKEAFPESAAFVDGMLARMSR